MSQAVTAVSYAALDGQRSNPGSLGFLYSAGTGSRREDWLLLPEDHRSQMASTKDSRNLPSVPSGHSPPAIKPRHLSSLVSAEGFSGESSMVFEGTKRPCNLQTISTSANWKKRFGQLTFSIVSVRGFF